MEFPILWILIEIIGFHPQKKFTEQQYGRTLIQLIKVVCQYADTSKN